jgi:ABC-type nitrate/sulfonate/bicarbonate transport system substrate-binding protein
MAEVVVANTNGYFKDEGLTVEVKFVSFGSEIPPAVAGGSIVLGKQAGGGVILMAQTTPVRVFVRTSDISGGIGVVVRPQANIKTIKDLEGKKLGMPKTTPNTDGVKKLASAYGADYSKITIVNLQPADAVTAFQKGDIDAAILALMRAMKRGIDYIKSNPNEAATIVAPAMNSTPEFMKTAFQEFGFTFDFDDSNLATPMDALSQLLLESGDNKSAPKFKDYSDPSFLRKLYPDAVKTSIN